MNCNYAFDLGNVLVKFDQQAFESKLKFKSFGPHLMDQVFHNQYEIGLINFEDICKHVFDRFSHLHIKQDFMDTIDAWNQALQPDPEMIEFFGSLQFKKNTSKIALLSNIGYEHADYLLKQCPEFAASPTLIHHFSYEVGARKPSKLFFQSFLHERNSFRGSLFFDDRPENVIMARKQGLDAYTFSLEVFKTLPQADRDKIKEMIAEYKVDSFKEYPQVFAIRG